MDIDKRTPFSLLVFFMVVTIGNGFVTTSNMLTENEAINYLEKFNYLNETVVKASLPTGAMPVSIVEGAISKFQEMVNIPITGKFDEETLRKMALPRCGVKDVPDNGPAKRYGEQVWPKKVLSWKITEYSKTSTLNQFEQRDAMRRAFDIWAKQTPLRFEYKEGGITDMSIKFATRYHGDKDPFDGPGKVLAHAFLPTDGNIHFDDQENWLLGARAEMEGTELYQVAAHEVGHALGLEHSNVRGSVMAPTFQYYSYLRLNWNDESDIQRLYGKPYYKRKNTWWFLRK
ncbi:hypothetical protein ACJMK2_011504 [Sinanodonta woodiana]|uniref:Peptidase metallopeptidase domain-containing protein n=1 Tax=Sinanodonta woodiana TaxID=1069815 RepID=A0ABD3V579_SINWO